MVASRSSSATDVTWLIVALGVAMTPLLLGAGGRRAHARMRSGGIAAESIAVRSPYAGVQSAG
jgi:hypothetical protein